MKQNEHCQVARAILRTVRGLCQRGLSLSQAEALINVWIDTAETHGAEQAGPMKASADYWQRLLVEALTPGKLCAHLWGENGACCHCGVLQAHVDPIGYAKVQAASDRLRGEDKAIKAYTKRLEETTPSGTATAPKRIPLKRSS